MFAKRDVIEVPVLVVNLFLEHVDLQTPDPEHRPDDPRRCFVVLVRLVPPARRVLRNRRRPQEPTIVFIQDKQKIFSDKTLPNSSDRRFALLATTPLYLLLRMGPRPSEKKRQGPGVQPLSPKPAVGEPEASL